MRTMGIYTDYMNKYLILANLKLAIDDSGGQALKDGLQMDIHSE